MPKFVKNGLSESMAIITDFSQLDLTKKYTYADYLTWQLVEGRSDVSVELIKGKVARMSPAPKRIHQAISGQIFAEVQRHLRGKSCKVYHLLPARFDSRPNISGLFN